MKSVIGGVVMISLACAGAAGIVYLRVGRFMAHIYPSEKVDWHRVSPVLQEAATPDVQIVREEKNGPARDIEHFLQKKFVTDPAVVRAYLVDVKYGSERSVARAIQFEDYVSAGTQNTQMRRFMTGMKTVIDPSTTSLDFLPLRSTVPIPASVKPFYVRQAGLKQLNKV